MPWYSAFTIISAYHWGFSAMNAASLRVAYAQRFKKQVKTGFAYLLINLRVKPRIF